MLWVFLLRLVVKKISVRNHNEQIVSSLINLHNFLPTTRAHPIFDRLQNTMQQQIMKLSAFRNRLHAHTQICFPRVGQRKQCEFQTNVTII